MPQPSLSNSDNEAATLAWLDVLLAALLLIAPLAMVTFHLYPAWTKPRYPVVGYVLLDGVPIEHADVQLHAAVDSAVHGLVSRGKSDELGRFEIASRFAGLGVPVGDYVVTVEYRPPEFNGDEFVPGPNVLPPWYAKRDQSPLRLQVWPSAQNTVTFNLSYCDRKSELLSSGEE